MRQAKARRILSCILCVALIAALALTSGCSGVITSPDGPTVYTDGAKVGAGDVQFQLIIADKDKKEIKLEVHTDKKTVGEALLEHQVIAGEDGAYGLYVKTVNGITADYDVDGAYWAFYENGQYASAGVDSTPVTPNATYAFRVETAE